MMPLACIPRWILVCWVAMVLAACGGGDGSTARAPLPTLSQDINPTGTRLDLRARNYFPMAPGDRWVYQQQRNGTPTGLTIVRNVTAGALGDVVLTETFPGDLPDITTFRRTAEGLLTVQPLGTDFSPVVNQIVGDLLAYAEPFYPVGATRTTIRQGSLGEDVDGDGRDDSFRLEITQVLVGFESVVLPNETARDVARFRNVTSLTLQPSDIRLDSITIATTEQAWWAPGIGLVRAEYVVTDSEGLFNDPGYTLVVSEAVVGGVDVLAAKPDGTVTRIDLPHSALVYDRTRGVYYASLPGSVPGQGNRIAIVSAATGAVSYSPQTVGSDPFAMAVSADGAALFVGLNGSGDVVKLRLPDFAEQWRARLPTDTFFGQLKAEGIAASPLDADTVAVSTFRTGVSPRHGGVVLVQAGTVLPTRTREHTGSNLVVFDGSGRFVYGFNSETTEFGLRRIAVRADGLQEETVVTTTGSFATRSIDWVGDRVVVGSQVFRTPDLALNGEAGSAGGNCRVAGSGTRLVCLPGGFTGGQDSALAVVDLSSLVITATPRYARGATSASVVDIVPGPAGQAAIRLASTTFGGAPAESIWLFDSVLLP